MKQKLAHVAIVVDDYDKAISYYTGSLSFVLVEDTKLSENKRWVLVAPTGDAHCSLLLAKASTDEQVSRIGNQTGGRVFLFLHTDDLDRDYKRMIAEGVSFVRQPVTEEWGKVAVFSDLYGNLWDLIQPAETR